MVKVWFSVLIYQAFKVFKETMKYTLFKVTIARLKFWKSIIFQEIYKWWLRIWIIFLLLLFYFLRCRVKNSFFMYLLWCNRWINSSSFKQKIQKWIESFWLKVRWFPIKLLMAILKVDVISFSFSFSLDII